MFCVKPAELMLLAAAGDDVDEVDNDFGGDDLGVPLARLKSVV